MEIDNKTLGTVTFIFLLMVGGAYMYTGSDGYDYYLSEETIAPTWQCDDPLIKSDCVNGIKADGKRCYYAPDDGRKYKNCASLWQEIKQPIDSEAVWGKSFKIKDGQDPILIE